ncbi:hypothetical protein L1987_45657 [Smallanthus sonchifolius]|uniref:Uncharacterized protein n=1 Tax=Smallanthus sonchifolius TaxID=185202 RepID=A0ACB9FX28_9ASTR|nr:hypothetical protein L1987_45657 [Smallanthus sonchifolius]
MATSSFTSSIPPPRYLAPSSSNRVLVPVTLPSTSAGRIRLPPVLEACSEDELEIPTPGINQGNQITSVATTLRITHWSTTDTFLFTYSVLIPSGLLSSYPHLYTTPASTPVSISTRWVLVFSPFSFSATDPSTATTK